VFFKHLFDFVIAMVGLFLLIPIILLLSLLIYFKLGSPVFFTQVRPGKNKILFTMYKFRSMKNLYDKDGVLLKDSDRLGPFGIFLRSTSLDELPELLNVIKGDMSLVGPRPLLVEYLPLYNNWQSRRHEVRPGITGWAQVNGRNRISWSDRFKFDIWYIDHMSYWLDLKILFVTVKNVVIRVGVTSDDNVTVEKFKGNVND